MSKVLVIVLSETRASELSFNSFKKNVIDELNADLCLCIGVKPDYDYNNPFYNLAKYKFTYDEPDDFGDAFEYAYNIIAKDRPKYECLKNINALYKKIQYPQQSTENITYYGNNKDITNFNNFNDDEIIIHNSDFPDNLWKNQVYGIKYSDNNNFIYQENVITYKKSLYWREFLKVKNQFLGGIKDVLEQHPGSAGILIFFRWFLLKNLIDNDLINKYDRFIITRSDFIYQLPHPKVELMNEDYIWIPDCEHYCGYTDRHVILSKNNIESYLNILNNFVLRSNEYFIKMKNYSYWNLEKLIKFHFEQNNVLHLVKEFPYIMYSVRNINGSTRWSEGIYSNELGYYIKYYTEYDKSSYYKNEFEKSGLTIDDFYKDLYINMTKNCIIGYTGFVGFNIINNRKIWFDEFYNSKNINTIKDNYNIILFAGLPGNVGEVNKNYKEDLENVNFFINKLKNIKCKKFILISTINVYPNLNSGMMEEEILELEDSIDYYGKHRLIIEKFIIENYNDYHILRLPSIYGKNLKKGILFDLLYQNYLEGICLEDKLQFYDLSDINEHIEYMCKNKIKILNLVSESIFVKDIINNIFNNYKIINNSQIIYNDIVINIKKRQPKKLNICSKYFERGYIYNGNDSIKKIKNFIENTTKLLILIPLYKIDKHLYETNINNNLFNCYENMFKIASESYLKHNNNIEIRKLENDNKDKNMNNFGDMFRDITKKMLDIHFIEKRDILYVESDTFCFDKITFNDINKLLMFNLGTGTCDLYKKSEMMNSGVIYFPKNCNIDYNFALELFNNCDFNVWINFEKFWNILYYNQFINFEESIKYNKYIGKYNFFKTCFIENDFIMNIRTKDFYIKNKPSIVHICSSRGAAKCLDIMNSLKDLKIPEDANIIYETLPFL
jgi:hypothetical protein